MDGRNMKHQFIILLAALFALLLLSCREDVPLLLSEETITDPGSAGAGRYAGFYLLNEGNMGSNKATLDYYDFATGLYLRNIYAERNPSVPKELGDVGNDLQLYGNRLYAVINASNKVEVMDAQSTRRLGYVDIPNCRYIAFHEGYAYVTSYAGPIEIVPEYKQKGYVVKIDTTTLQVVGQCVVGYQPDGIAISGGHIYVANSGGYRGASHPDNYERTISVIEMETFKEINRIDVAFNLHRIVADPRGNLWVTSREATGNPSRLFFIDHQQQEVTDTIALPVSDMWMDGDSLYLLGMNHYSIVYTDSREVVNTGFITEGPETQFETPYGIMVHPETKDIYITDAGDYINPGVLYRFDREGRKKWSLQTGDIPSRFVLLPKKK
jgi:DNA-binding beta-propeller fold protein YncE